MLLGRLPGLLGRLRVRQKLVLLVLPLLVLVVIGAVPLVADRIGAAEKSSRTAHVVQRAVRIGDLVQELQQERLASVGYLSAGVGRDRLVARSARAVDQAAQLATDYRDEDDDRLASALRTVTHSSGLGGLRGRVLRGGVSGLTVYMGYTRAIDGLLDALRLSEDADLSTEVGRQELALDSIIRHDEGTAAAGAALFLDAKLELTDAVLALVSAEAAIEDREERVFKPLADPDTVELYELVEDGPSRQGVSRYLDQLEEAPGSIRGRTVPRELLAKIESVTVLGRLVETRAAAGAARGAAESATRDRWLAGLGLALALVVLAGAAVLSMLVARSISGPLRRLTESADEVAEVARAELVRVADTEEVGAAAPHLQPVQVGTADELGELAAAFNRVQQVAADLVERQVVSRRNVATMYGNVGRRTQNLVGRQLAMIDSLERNEQDPAMLDRLYRLDHVSTRLRRNANSLIVLSGSAEPELMSEPLSIAGAVRSALGEIEGFQRVRLTDFDPALLTPQVAPDVILLLAELLENGTSFSPPDTEVEVGATWIGNGDVLVRIVDHGLGMTPEQLDAENARLVERERLDLAPTDVLGLFVVGRLARRHRIQVTLRPTTGTGVTADVLIPARHLVTGSDSGAWYGSSRGSDSGRVPVAAVAANAASAAGMASARGWWEPPVVNRAPVPRPPGAPAEAAEPPAPHLAGPRPSRPERPVGEVGPGGIVRRVRGAQLPDTGGPAPVDSADAARDEPQVSTGSPDEARRAIEDFEEGVRRALRESAAVRAESDELSRRNGHLRMSGWSGPLLPGPMPGPPLPPSATGPVDPTRSLLEEFEEGVRRALARIDAVSRHRKQGGDGSSMWGTFFERTPSRPVPAAGPNGGGTTSTLPATTPGGRPEASPDFRAGASAADVAPPRERASTTDHPASHPAGGEGAAGTAFRPPVEPVSSSEGDSRVDAAAGAGGPGPAAPSAPPGSAATGGPDGPDGSGPPRAAGARDGGAEPGMSSPAEAGIAGSDGSGVVPASRMPEQASNQESTQDSRQDEVHPLVRRVPGTQMPEGARAAPPPKPPQPSPDAAARDAEAARALVEEFEAGVQRALRSGDDGPGAEDEEGGAG